MATQTHTGGCQCGAVRYQAEIDLEKPSLECNCSRCGRIGSMLQFVPEPQFSQEHGIGATTEYRFNTGKIGHEFCSTCGVQCFGKGSMPDGTPVIAVNVRTLDDVDLGAVPKTSVNGKDF
jgi:hypothetical protein